MSRIYVGMRVRTSYRTGPYVVTSYQEGCTCPRFIDSLNLGDKAPLSRPHYHLQCRGLDGKGSYYLNGYDDNLQSVWDNDYLVDLSDETTLLTLSVNSLHF